MTKTRAPSPPPMEPVVPQRPRGGGSYIRDRQTGEFTLREGRTPAAFPPVPPSADTQAGDDAGNPGQED